MNMIEKYKKPEVILVLGAPGSGKGTQGKKISEKYEFQHISMGDVLRNKKNEIIVGEYNKQLSSIKDTPLTHELSLRLLKNEMIDMGWEKTKFVLDGFHRKFDKYDIEFFESINLLCVIVLKPTTINILFERVMKRYLENINTSNHRKDDLELVEKRLNIYKTETQEVISFFKDKYENKIKEICCDLDEYEVFTEIETYLDEIVY